MKKYMTFSKQELARVRGRQAAPVASESERLRSRQTIHGSHERLVIMFEAGLRWGGGRDETYREDAVAEYDRWAKGAGWRTSGTTVVGYDVELEAFVAGARIGTGRRVS